MTTRSTPSDSPHHRRILRPRPRPGPAARRRRLDRGDRRPRRDPTARCPGGHHRSTALPGDVADAEHRAALVELVDRAGRARPARAQREHARPAPHAPAARSTDPLEIGEVFRTNAGAPGRADDRARRPAPVVATASSSGSPPTPRSSTTRPGDAYGASKAALDHLVLTFGEETGLATYAVDPGDMRTPMQQDAFPGEDISDRPLPRERGAAAPRTARAASGARALPRRRRRPFRRWPRA